MVNKLKLQKTTAYISNFSLEGLYSANAPESHRKRYGQYFTPDLASNYMAEWIGEIKPASILDPAIGTGALLRASDRRITNKFCLDGYDSDPRIVSFLLEHGSCENLRKAVVEDFLTADVSQAYDAVIMNPPYLRHHDMPYRFDVHSHISILGNIKISKLSNSYLLFVVKACEVLRHGGRAAVIIPTEWANANFGKTLKEYLIGNGYLRHIIYFSNSIELFSDALTTSCILLIEKDSSSGESIPCSYIDSVEGRTLKEILNHGSVTNFISTSELMHSSKWDHLIKTGSVVTYSGFVDLSELASTKRGIATGANSYFHISLDDAQRHKINAAHLLPCIGRAQDVEGYRFTLPDYERLVENKKKTHLIAFNHNLSDEEKEYIRLGEELALPSRFLLSHRKPWYMMENRKVAPIWAAVFGRSNLRFVYNEAMISNLTTFHGVYPYDTGEDHIRAMVVVLNSRLVRELARANVRVYGGGLLKFEPKDILEIKVPDLRYASMENLKELSSYIDRIGDPEYQQDIDDLVLKAANDGATNRERLF